MAGASDIRLHVCALNGRDLDHIARSAQPDAPCFCDGEWVGEGPEAMVQALEREFGQEIIARLGRLQDEPVILEVAGGEGAWETRGAVRIVGDTDGRIRELRIEHRPNIVQGLVPEPDV